LSARSFATLYDSTPKLGGFYVGSGLAHRHVSQETLDIRSRHLADAFFAKQWLPAPIGRERAGFFVSHPSAR
jgi:hypothetical protein